MAAGGDCLGAGLPGERFAALGAEPMQMAPAEFTRFVKREMDDAARIARAGGIKVQ